MTRRLAIRRPAVPIACVAFVLGVSVSGCSVTTTATPPPVTVLAKGPQPSPRNWTQIAYFPPMREVVLFGGQTRTGKSLDDTWVFTESRWHRLQLVVSPPAQAQGAMAYDPDLRELVLFGGWCGPCGSPDYRITQDTWAFNGTSWKELHSSLVPAWEPSPTMSWDPLTRELELLAPPPGYGTKPIGQSFDANPDVRLGRWAWTSTGWKWRGNATGPPLTDQQPTFVAIPGQSEMLYFLHYQYFTRCFCDNAPIQVSETWTWNGHVFREVHPKSDPSAFPSIVVSDPHFGVVSMNGERAWLWNGSNWVAQPGRGLGVRDVAGVYDPALGAVVTLAIPYRGPRRSVTGLWRSPSSSVTVPGAPELVGGGPRVRRVVVSWRPPSNDGGAPVTSFTATVEPGGRSCTTGAYHCTVGGLVDGRAYDVLVYATNSAGKGPVREGNFIAGGPPSTPRDFHVVAWSQGVVTLSWRSSVVPPGMRVTSYDVAAYVGKRLDRSVNTHATSCRLRGFAAHRRYVLAVSANDLSGGSPHLTLLVIAP